MALSVEIKDANVPPPKIIIIYTHEDEDIVTDIENTLREKGFNVTRDKYEIWAGLDWQRKLDQMYEDADCAIVILTKNVIENKNCIRAPWVIYEFGVLKGLGKFIIPYLGLMGVSQKERDEFFNSLPDFIKRFQIAKDKSELLKVVKYYTPYYNLIKIFQDRGITEKDLKVYFWDKIVNKEIIIRFNLDKKFVDFLEFGFQIVRYGRAEFEEPSLTDIEKKLLNRLHHIVYIGGVTQRERADHIKRDVEAGIATDLTQYSKYRDVSYNIDKGEIQIRFVCPILRPFGVTFKLFVDVYSVSLYDEILEHLRNAGFAEVTRSTSAEMSRRIYLLIPEEKIPVVEEPFGGCGDEERIRNNFIFPV